MPDAVDVGTLKLKVLPSEDKLFIIVTLPKFTLLPVEETNEGINPEPVSVTSAPTRPETGVRAVITGVVVPVRSKLMPRVGLVSL